MHWPEPRMTEQDQSQVNSLFFHAYMSQPDKKTSNLPYDTLTPHSKTVLYDVVCKLARALEDKKMLFAIIVIDRPVYSLLLELKNENPQLFSDILPLMKAFSIHMYYISVIYNIFKG